MKRVSRVIDMTGKEIGRLRVVGRAGFTPKGQAIWSCLCLCGKETLVRGADLRNGHTQSCGCLFAERAREVAARANITHGLSNTVVYRAWKSMRERCGRPSHNQYADYGGRGIQVCDRWHTFTNFVADMGHPPPKTSLDRIDNNGDYEPANCRWATASEQQNNRRSTVKHAINGVEKSVSQWARDAGLSPACVFQRLRAGWLFERAISTPVVPSGFKSKTKSRGVTA